MLASEDRLMTVREVARVLKVTPETVRRWATTGKLVTAVKTPGGHYRFSHTMVVGLAKTEEPEES